MLLYQKLLQMAQNSAFGKLVFMIHHQLFSLPSIHENVINRTKKLKHWVGFTLFDLTLATIEKNKKLVLINQHQFSKWQIYEL